MLTGQYRKAAKVPYPNCYATMEQAEKDPAAFKFNCGMFPSHWLPSPSPGRVALTISPPTCLAQRAHANFTENVTTFLGSLFIAGLQFPIVSASIGAAWAVSRVLYARGYTSNGPKGRYM